MKKSLRFVTCLAVAGCLCGTALLGGCASDTGRSKEGRLSLWVGEQLEDMFKQMAKDYTEETGFPVVVNTYTGLTASDKLALDGPFGRGGDVYMQGGGGDLAKAIEQGLFLELGKEEMELETKFIEGAQGLMQYKGKLYGVPLGTETNAMFYNKDILPEFPETWEEMIEWVKEYNDFVGQPERKKQFGLLIDYTNPYYTWAINEAYGAYVFGKDEAGNWDPTDLGFDTEGSIKAYEMMKGLIDDKVIPTDMAITLMQTKFRSGKAAIILDGSWDLANFRKAGINVGIAKIPDIQISATETGTPVAFSGGYGLAINSYSLNPEESKDFLKFATQDKYVMQYYEATGRIPATVGCSESEAVLADDCLAGFYAQLEDSYPQPSINEMNAVWDPLTAAAVAIFTNNEDIAKTLHKVKSDVEANIKLLS
jgi:arabinogalactan oligomer/maltooligosaccharide transport system substrate-binding protein